MKVRVFSALSLYLILSSTYAIAESCKMTFYIENNTNSTIKLADPPEYKLHNSSWDTNMVVYFDDHDPDSEASYVGFIRNYIISCKSKRRVKIKAKCSGGDYVTYTSGWIKNGGKNMDIYVTYNKCPDVENPVVRDEG